MVCAAYGFPAPSLQHPVETDDGLFYVDAFFPQSGVAVELDGMGKYDGDSGALQREKRRELAIARQGISIARFSFRELLRPRAVAVELVARVPRATSRQLPCQRLLAEW